MTLLVKPVISDGIRGVFCVKQASYHDDNKVRRSFIMNRLKKSQTSDLNYISEERKKELEQVFNTLDLMDRESAPNYSHPSEGYNTPFKQFSVLKNEKIIFNSSN